MGRVCKAAPFAVALSATMFAPLSTTLAQTPPKTANSTEPDAALPPLSYTPAEDRQLHVEVQRVLRYKDRGYLPKDRDWLQLHLTVANRSRRTLQFTAVRAQFAGGTVISSATTGEQLAKPPSAGGTAGRTLGAGVAGQILGTMLFPPLALVASAGSLFGMTGGMGSWRKRVEQINAGLLTPQDVAPGTSIAGDVYIPAAANQQALLIFYAIDGRSESLALNRARTVDERSAKAQ